MDFPKVSDLFSGLVGMLLEVAPLVCRKYKFIVIRHADRIDLAGVRVGVDVRRLALV